MGPWRLQPTSYCGDYSSIINGNIIVLVFSLSPSINLNFANSPIDVVQWYPRVFSILHLDCQGKSHFLFYFIFPSLFSLFFLPLLIHPLLPPPSILFPLPHSHSIHHHPLTGAPPFLSFHFRRARITSPYYHFIVLYYLSIIIAIFFFTLKNIKKPHPKIETCIQAGPFSILSFTRSLFSIVGTSHSILRSAQLSSSEHL